MVNVKRKGKRPTNVEMFSRINQLSAGESLVIKLEEWKMKTLPGQHLIRRRLNREFKVETLVDESGWKVTAL